MKNKGIRILSLLLAVISLLGILGFPAAASMGYPMKYTIYYKAGGKRLGQTDGSCDAAADIRNNVRVPSPSYNGYVLKNDSDAVVTGSMISWKFPPSHYVRHGTGSYTVYYEKACKMVVHYACGSSLRQATADKVAYGKRGTEYYIVSPTISGYTPTRSAVSGKYSSDSNSSTVYYYENTYTVSYDANGGSGAPGSQTKAHFTPLTLSTQQPRRTGYTFLGWSSNPSAVSASYSPGDTYYRNGSTTLYAVWSSKAYTVFYNANGGSGAPSPQTKSYGQTIYLSDKIPTRSGYTFLGWGLTSSATVAAYQPGEAYYANASRTFYAVWEKNTPPAPDVYTVRYNANGGFGAPSAQTKKQNITLVLSSVKPQRNGYAFCGWATTPTAAAPEYAPGDSYTEDKNITLYAVWRYSPKTYTVSYDANGSSGAPANQTKKHGQNLILTGAIPTRPNHVFLGWATDSSSTSIAYTPGATYTADEDITLYAVPSFILLQTAPKLSPISSLPHSRISREKATTGRGGCCSSWRLSLLSFRMWLPQTTESARQISKGFAESVSTRSKRSTVPSPLTRQSDGKADSESQLLQARTVEINGRLRQIYRHAREC